MPRALAVGYHGIMITPWKDAREPHTQHPNAAHADLADDSILLQWPRALQPNISASPDVGFLLGQESFSSYLAAHALPLESQAILSEGSLMEGWPLCDLFLHGSVSGQFMPNHCLRAKKKLF